jgi:hypothetical protein
VYKRFQRDAADILAARFHNHAKHELVERKMNRRTSRSCERAVFMNRRREHEPCWAVAFPRIAIALRSRSIARVAISCPKGIDMKLHLATAALASALALAAPAAAQSYSNWRSINERQAMLDQRIDAGVRNGSLTRREAESLRGEFRQIAYLERRYRVGGLSLAERRDLDRRFDALSARIRYERADRQDRFGIDRYAWDWRDRFGNWWSVNARQRELNRRIEVGIRRGELTRAEAARLRQRYYAIVQLEQRYRRSGGGLSYAERRDLDRRFAYLAQAIRWERNDWQERA